MEFAAYVPWLKANDNSAAVYTADLRLRRSFITIIESVLREMADVLREIEDINTRTAHPTIDTISTLTSHLSLTCHQVIPPGH